MAVQYRPDGYHTVTPYLPVRGVRKLLDFVTRAFGAEIKFEMPRPDGGVGHAEFQIGDSLVMAGEPGDEHPVMPAMLHLYVPDVDAVFAKALAAGGEVVREVRTEFYGDRTGGLKDPCGNQWWIATHVEDVPPDELEKRAAAAGK